MPSQLLADPATHLTPAQRQDLANARSNPIGSAKDAASSLTLLDTAHGHLLALVSRISHESRHSRNGVALVYAHGVTALGSAYLPDLPRRDRGGAGLQG